MGNPRTLLRKYPKSVSVPLAGIALGTVLTCCLLYWRHVLLSHTTLARSVPAFADEVPRKVLQTDVRQGIVNESEKFSSFKGPFEHLDFQKWIQAAHQDFKEKVEAQTDFCNQLNGLAYLKDYTGRRVHWCVADANAKTPSAIYLYPLSPQQRTAVVGESFNVTIDTAKFMAGTTTTTSLIRDEGGIPNPEPGCFKAACTKQSVPSVTPDHLRKEVAAQWFERALVDNQLVDVHEACSNPANVVEHPVYFVTRYASTNFYHSMEDIVTLFVSLAAVDSRDVVQKGLEIVIADGKVPGFYMELWHRISHPYPVRFLTTNPFPPNTCFRHVFHSAWAEASLLSYPGVGTENTCLSVVNIAASNWLRALFPEIYPKPQYTGPATTQSGGIVYKTVIWITRRNFECVYRDTFTGWQMNRVYYNEKELLSHLQNTVYEWNEGSCLRQRYFGRTPDPNCRNKTTFYELQYVELSDIPFFPDQLFKLMKSTILMTVHGAALGNIIWFDAGTGGMLELSHNTPGNHHYHNMAYWMGHKYRSVSSGGRMVDINKSGEALSAMMEDLA